MECIRALLQDNDNLDDTVAKNVARILFSTTDLIRREDIVVAFLDHWRQRSKMDIPRRKQDTAKQPEQAPTLDKHQERFLTLIINEYVD